MLKLIFTNPIYNATYIRVLLGSDIGLSFTYNYTSQNSIQPTLVASAVGSLLIGNLTNSATQPSFLFIGYFTLINPPYANTPISMTFQTENLVDSVYYLVDRTTIYIQSVSSTLVQFAISSNNTSINQLAIYKLWFIIINKLKTNSVILLKLPNQLNTLGLTCAFSAASSCAILNSSFIRVVLTVTALNPGTNLSITLTNILNPVTTTPTSSFSIFTYYYNESTPVDLIE
jgi:hypothetical protein